MARYLIPFKGIDTARGQASCPFERSTECWVALTRTEHNHIEECEVKFRTARPIYRCPSSAKRHSILIGRYREFRLEAYARKKDKGVQKPDYGRSPFIFNYTE